MIAGGGTAGHVLPGLAVAHALVERSVVPGPEFVHVVGSRRGIETSLVPEAGFGLTVLPGRGIQRRLTPANLLAVSGLVAALLRALYLLVRHRPSVVLATGGYASIPCGLAAALLRVPLLVAEQNAVAGEANRLLGRFAVAAVVAFPGTGLRREVLTGNPVRHTVRDLSAADSRQTQRERMGLGPTPLLLAFGGSLGARRINGAVVEMVEGWAGGDIAVHHVIGRRDWHAHVANLPAPARQVDYRPVVYEKNLPELLAAADLVICRAGATTVAELTVIGRPAVLVPLPGAPRDHQRLNAESLVAAGAAVLVTDADLDGTRLAVEVQSLLDDPDTLDEMGERSRTAGRADAADLVADLVGRVAAGEPVSPEHGRV
ncbi:MAG: UDP-N-acetylglucosamine--N-acetylmuramyl-(pentapeptide) pyrophosphoryl-undecaprenol N-acetylglucosamine transferase [Acidimicrobiaceae bacterium]|nr:UDP-N-acetylglucosamine--N-acetylmuramyl-(pentapeptide) pyrophosphoryl-undecaprenol N-acetylglucosamine transferase [Acidimicrobiaceae bacterium]